VPPLEEGPGGDEAARFDEVPPSDPVHEIIQTILRLVPVSHWSFARFKSDGDVNQLLSSSSNGDEFAKLENGKGNE
jgi:hypothetical protein